MSFDTRSNALIAQLLREDLDSLIASNKGKQRNNTLTDAQMALKLQLKMLDELDSSLLDAAFASSMHNAVTADASLLQEHHREEAQARCDHDMALRWSGQPVPTDRARPSDPQICSAQPFSDPKKPCNPPQIMPSMKPESSRQAVQRAERMEAGNITTCIACTGTFPTASLIKAPCGHKYCEVCIGDLYTASMTDETLFPPRCCKQEIPLQDVRHVLRLKLAQDFEEKYLELSTVNKTYCWDTKCSTFIPPFRIHDDVGYCSACWKMTCSICKGKAHDGNCPQDSAFQALVTIAEANGWQRCRKCHRFVELTVGCYHMTCPCGSQFCYKCGVQWKNCKCPQWTEARLYDRAATLADRRVNDGRTGRAATVLPTDAQIAEVMEELREDHNCQHAAWTKVEGQHACENCFQVLREFILQCRHCRLNACVRCRRNRL